MLNSTPPTSKRSYSSLADYAAQQGIPEAAFMASGWRLTTYKGRPALQYPTATGNRWRYLDGGDKRHDSPFGYKPSWYGLKRAIELSTDHKPLVMVNGAAGVIVAQHFGIPAFAVSDGEQRKIPEPMLVELKTAWSGEILVALDCDQTGQQSAAKRTRQLLDAGWIARAVNLQLGKNGDIADLCKVYRAGTFDHLQTLPEIAPAAPQQAYKPREGATPLTSSDERAKRIAAKWLDNNLSELARTTSGRRITLLKVATKISGLVKGGYLSSAEAERGMMTAAASCGLMDKYGEKAIERTLADCYKAAAATVIEQPSASAQGKRAQNRSETRLSHSDVAPQARPWPPKLPPASLEKPAANTQVNSRYLSDAALPETARTLAIRSPLGSGKNQWVIQHINRHQPRRILYVTFQQSLTENATERLNTGIQGELFEHYLNIPAEFNLSTIDRLVVSLNSLYRCAKGKAYDLVVMDEIEQVIPALWAGTLHGSDIPRAYQVLLADILQPAGQVIALDAHLSQQSVDFLSLIRGPVEVIENLYCPIRPTMTLYHYETKMMEAAITCAEQNPTLPIVITSSSRKLARRYRRLFTTRYGADKVKLIYGWNSHEKDIRAFLKNINNNLPHLRVLITSPTVGTGVDVTCAVAGVFGCFPGNHLAPTAMLQQLARYRNARTFNATIPNMESSASESVNDLLSRTRFKIQQTRTLAGVVGEDVSAEQGAITLLWASYTALHNRLSNRPLSTFTQLAQSEGFPIEWVDGRSEGLQHQLKTAQEAQQHEDDTLTLSLAPISTEEMDQLRMQGDLIEDDHLAHRRWKIEDTTGQTIAPDLLARYSTPTKLKTLVRFTTYQFGGMIEAKRLDRAETGPVLPFKRMGAALNNTFLNGLLRAAFGEDGLQSTEALTVEELTQRLIPYLEAHRETIRALDDRRTDFSEKPLAIFRRMLGRFGLKLSYRRIRVEDRLTYAYKLDRSSLTILMADAEQRWKMLQSKLFQNAGISASHIRDLEQPDISKDMRGGRAGLKLPASDDYVARRRASRLPINPFTVKIGAG